MARQRAAHDVVQDDEGDGSPLLRVVASVAVGVDNVDLAAVPRAASW